MRHVFPSAQVAHLWANQSQSEARNATNTVYFRDSTIYSYGGHFPIARHVKNKRGESAVLFTTRDYSVTTSGHKSMVASAASHLTMFRVHNVCETNHKDTLKDYESQVIDLLAQAKRARKRSAWLIDQAQELITEANAYAQFFGLKKRLGTPSDFAELVADSEANRKATLAADRARLEAKKRELQTHLDRWIAGEEVHHNFSILPVALRVRGDELQTTKGASVPVEHARKAFAFVKRCHNSATAWQRNGQQIRVGHFQIDSIDTEGNVKAGCHNITWREIERLATAQGW